MSNPRKRLPHEIDPFRLADTGAELEGRIPLKQLQRLGPLLLDDSGEAAVVLKFGIDDLGVPVVSGTLSAKLVVSCQRCLGRYEIPVQQTLNLAWVRSDQEASRLPLRLEPYLVESTPLNVNDVIEEELLLALPQIPMHEAGQCSTQQWVADEATQDDEDSTTENPFAILAKLKDKD